MLTQLEKRKIINLIIQGEAKNTKMILRMPEVKEGVEKILGKEKGEELVESLIKIAENADRLDWLIPTRERGMQMQHGNFFGGAVGLDWK